MKSKLRTKSFNLQLLTQYRLYLPRLFSFSFADQHQGILNESFNVVLASVILSTEDGSPAIADAQVAKAAPSSDQLIASPLNEDKELDKQILEILKRKKSFQS